MCEVSDLFCKNDNNAPIEGYLSDQKKSRILFVLREPDDPNLQDGFWFKDVVNDVIIKDKTGTKYKNVLGMIANKLLYNSKERLVDYKQILKECAYINVYPFCGKSTKTDKCEEVIRALSDANADNGKSIDSNSSAKAIADNRIRIIRDINCEYVVTVWDIFNAIKHDNTMLKGIQYKYRNSPEFGAFAWSENKTVFKFLHPCCRISYDKLIYADYSIEEKKS